MCKTSQNRVKKRNINIVWKAILPFSLVCLSKLQPILNDCFAIWKDFSGKRKTNSNIVSCRKCIWHFVNGGIIANIGFFSSLNAACIFSLRQTSQLVEIALSGYYSILQKINKNIRFTWNKTANGIYRISIFRYNKWNRK